MLEDGNIFFSLVKGITEKDDQMCNLHPTFQ